MSSGSKLGIRWTVGDVSRRGYEALRLSVWGAYRLFGPEAAYTVNVNTVPLGCAQALVGELPEAVRVWLEDGERGRSWTARLLSWRGRWKREGCTRPGLKAAVTTKGIRSAAA